jgi:hypothetical protein
VSRALACVLKHPWLVAAHRCFALLPRLSILCGCINAPARQANAVWGRCPTACTTYVKKKQLGVYWGLVDKISPAFVRVEKLGCAGSRQVIPAVYRLLLRLCMCRQRQVGPPVNLGAPTGMPASVSSRSDLADSAYTFGPCGLQTEDLALQKAFPGKTFSSPKLEPRSL